MNNNYTENAIVNNTSFGIIKNNVNNNFEYIADEFSAVEASIGSELAQSVKFGVYVGDGASYQEISLGAKPKAVVVYRYDGYQQAGTEGQRIFGGLAIDGHPLGGDDYPILKITNSGFKVYTDGNNINTNHNTTIYYYIAFMVGTIDNS